MKVVFHEAFYPVYAGDPAAAASRMEAIMETVSINRPPLLEGMS